MGWRHGMTSTSNSTNSDATCDGFLTFILLSFFYMWCFNEAISALLKKQGSPSQPSTNSVEQQGMIHHEILLKHPDLRSDVHGRFGHHHVATAGYDHRAHVLGHNSQLCPKRALLQVESL